MDNSEYFDRLASIDNRRSVGFDDVEMKDGGNVFLFDGYAAVYATPVPIGDRFTEEVAPGAFRSILATKPNVPLLHEHDHTQMLGTTGSGRVRLEDDKRGLRVRAKIPKTPLTSHIKALVDGGDVKGMSYGFVAGRDNQKITEVRNQRPHRLLTGFRRLLDVTTTWDPAYPTTEAQFRSRVWRFSTLTADSPEDRELLLMGAYPQLEELALSEVDMREAGEARTTVTPPRVGEQQLAAAKRRLQFIQLTGGYDDAS